MILRLFGHTSPPARILSGCEDLGALELDHGGLELLSDHVDCYSVAHITIGAHATVSQYSYLCSASHDYRVPTLPMVAAPIVIERMPGSRLPYSSVLVCGSARARSSAPVPRLPRMWRRGWCGRIAATVRETGRGLSAARMEPSREPDLPSQPHVTASQHELAIFAAMSVAAPALLQWS